MKMIGGYWAHNEPNNHAGNKEDCMTSHSGQEGRFHDTICDWKPDKGVGTLCQLTGEHDFFFKELRIWL